MFEKVELNSMAKDIFVETKLWDYQKNHLNNTKSKYYACLKAINYNQSIRAHYYTTTDIKACIEVLVGEYNWTYTQLAEIAGVSLNCIQNWAHTSGRSVRSFKRSSENAVAIIDHLRHNDIQSPDSSL